MKKTKAEIRKSLLSQRESLSKKDVSRFSAQIFEKFKASFPKDVITRWNTIALYAPIKNEVEITLFYDFFKTEKKQILFPRIESDAISFCVSTRDELVTGRFEILEPPRGAQKLNPDVVFVPAVAYAKNLHRLGFGKGFYDRWLGSLTSSRRPFLLGLAYDFQVLDNLPTEPHDQTVDAVVTPGHIYLSE